MFAKPRISPCLGAPRAAFRNQNAQPPENQSIADLHALCIHENSLPLQHQYFFAISLDAFSTALAFLASFLKISNSSAVCDCASDFSRENRLPIIPPSFHGLRPALVSKVAQLKSFIPLPRGLSLFQETIDGSGFAYSRLNDHVRKSSSNCRIIHIVTQGPQQFHDFHCLGSVHRSTRPVERLIIHQRLSIDKLIDKAQII